MPLNVYLYWLNVSLRFYSAARNASRGCLDGFLIAIIHPCKYHHRIYKMMMVPGVKVAKLDIDKIHPSEEVHAKRFLKL
jgi:hypothetical protein